MSHPSLSVFVSTFKAPLSRDSSYIITFRSSSSFHFSPFLCLALSLSPFSFSYELWFRGQICAQVFPSARRRMTSRSSAWGDGTRSNVHELAEASHESSTFLEQRSDMWRHVACDGGHTRHCSWLAHTLVCKRHRICAFDLTCSGLDPSSCRRQTRRTVCCWSLFSFQVACCSDQDETVATVKKGSRDFRADTSDSDPGTFDLTRSCPQSFSFLCRRVVHDEWARSCDRFEVDTDGVASKDTVLTSVSFKYCVDVGSL